MEQVTGGRVADPHSQEKAMSMNHDLITGLARDHQRQMLAEASRQQRHGAPQTRTATRIIRGLAAAITSARVAAARAPGVALARPPAPARPAIARRPAALPPADEAARHQRPRPGHPDSA